MCILLQIRTINLTPIPQILQTYVWAEIPDVIYYSDTDKATAIDTQSVIPNNEVTVGLSESVSQPTKAGYIFSGWKCVTDVVTVTDGKRSLSGTPTHAAYSFAGWSLDGTTAITEVTSDKFTEANSNTVTVTALWTEKIYKLVYNANSPTGSTSDVSGVPGNVELTYVQLSPGYTLGGSPTCENYNFLGWSKTANGTAITGVSYADWPADSDTLNVYATWECTLVGAEVTYLSGFTKSYVNDTDGEYVHAVADISTDYTVLANSWFTREGYTFDSWTVTNSAGKVSALDTLANILSISDVGDTLNPGDTTTLDGDLYLSAEWQLKEYNVKYDPNTSDEVKSMPTDETKLTVKSGFTLNSAKDAYVHTLSTKKPTRTGYTFIGWGLTAGSTAAVKSVNTTQFTSDTLTVYAIWDNITYKVTYNKNNSTEGTAPTDSNEYAVSDTVTVLDKGDLKCGDYTFKEWNTQKNGKGTGYQPGDTFSMPTNNVTLYAIWVNDKGDVISPGTGESFGIIMAAFTAMIISAGVIAAVMMIKRKRKFA